MFMCMHLPAWMLVLVRVRVRMCAVYKNVRVNKSMRLLTGVCAVETVPMMGYLHDGGEC